MNFKCETFSPNSLSKQDLCLQKNVTDHCVFPASDLCPTGLTAASHTFFNRAFLHFSFRSTIRAVLLILKEFTKIPLIQVLAFPKVFFHSFSCPLYFCGGDSRTIGRLEIPSLVNSNLR